MNLGLVLFGMLLAAPRSVVGTTYMVGLKENDDGSYPLGTFKSSSEVSSMTVKTEMNDFGIIVVEGTPEAAKVLESLSYVDYVEEDGEIEAFGEEQEAFEEEMEMGMKAETMGMENDDMENLEEEDMGM